ncbi:Large ribosomal subunit protein [Trichinella pseudospiralis]
MACFTESHNVGHNFTCKSSMYQLAKHTNCNSTFHIHNDINLQKKELYKFWRNKSGSVKNCKAKNEKQVITVGNKQK